MKDAGPAIETAEDLTSDDCTTGRLYWRTVAGRLRSEAWRGGGPGPRARMTKKSQRSIRVESVSCVQEVRD